jgi:diguanylate cyclase (GGDEF)-like protein
MRLATLKRTPAWMPAVAVAAVVIIAGARLITLSVRSHAADLRSAAQGTVSRQAHGIEVELQALLDRARDEARRAAGTGNHGGSRVLPFTAVPSPDAFWVAGTGVLLRSGDADPAVSGALASEWLAARPNEHSAAGLFGPIRYGSRWFVAAQAPVELPRTSSSTTGARAFAYEALDALLPGAGLARLVREGYDFELSQDAQNSPAPRVFLRSRAAALAEPVTGAILTPDAATSPPSPAFLQLAVRPHSGWYPIGPIAADVALLVLLAWALALGAYDLVHNARHAKRVLAAARGRLRLVHARLTAEIEQHEALQKNLEHARYHDPATGLPNRRYFMGQVDRALRDLHARRRQRLAVILIEIDRFALINDSLGHTAADDLMLQVAQRFERVLEPTEHTLARWSGDQCVALLYDVDSADVHTIAKALHGARQQPFALRKHRVKVGARIGFTCVERSLHRPEEALREADVALSVAKGQSGLATVEYTADMGGAAVSLVSLEADLYLALERGEFRLVFQPIFDLSDARVVGFEALLRWHHPVEGILTPDRFLSIANEVGVIVPVTRWIIQRVCRLIADWRASLPRHAAFYISVNLSAAAARDPGLCEHIAQVLQATRVPPGYLKFELPERGLIENVSAARAILAGFHDLGIELMLDDFGSGYASLSYLQLLPFDYVKIDRPFANRTGSERANNAITAAVLQMTASLGLRAIAEVVETEAAARSLAQLGCNFAQGNYFSVPLDAVEAFELVRRSPSVSTLVTAPPVDAAPPTDGTVEATMVLEDSPTLVLPDSPTLVLRAPDDPEDAVEEEAGAESHSGG